MSKIKILNAVISASSAMNNICSEISESFISESVNNLKHYKSKNNSAELHNKGKNNE